MAADKPLVWLNAEVRTPLFIKAARLEAGALLRRLQRGERLLFPHSRPMSVVGTRCHELRIVDVGHSWRIMYRIDADAIVIAGVFAKKTRETPVRWIATCKERLERYDRVPGEE